MNQLWRVKTLKRTDDIEESYVATSIDYVVESLDEAIEEMRLRLEDGVTLSVSISQEEDNRFYKTGIGGYGLVTS